MALINCSECGRRISDAASTCPGCGISAPKGAAQPKKDSWLAKLLFWTSPLYIIIGGLYAMAWYDGRLADTAAPPIQPEKTTSIDDALKREEARKLRAAESEARTRECKKDWACWAERNIGKAILKCQSGIEKQAEYDFEWTDGIFEPKFSRFKKARITGMYTYIGDKVRFQQPNGSWMRMTYYCNYMPYTNDATNIRVSQGRLR